MNAKQAAEQWKNIPGCENRYVVSNRGRVASIFKSRRSKNMFRILKGSLANGRYRIFSIYKNEKTSTHKLHPLVMKLFGLPKPSYKHEINHKNGNKLDNRIDNLEWVTRSENMIHGIKLNILSWCRSAEELQKIKTIILNNKGLKKDRELAEELGISRQYVNDIKNNKKLNWLKL